MGCTFYFLLVGHAPFPEGSLAQRILKHQQTKPTPLLEKRSDVPPELVVICNRMMEKNPDKRPQTAIMVAEQLADYLASKGKAVTGTSDSGAGSSIGLAASVVRELAQQAAKPQPEENDVDTLVETLDPGTAEAEKDTTISRSEAETRKSVPPLMDEDLGLAPDEKAEEPKANLAGTPHNRLAAEDEPEIDLQDLERQLKPLDGMADSMTAINMNAGTRLQSREPESQGIPAWVWMALGGGLLAIVVIGVLLTVL